MSLTCIIMCTCVCVCKCVGVGTLSIHLVVYVSVITNSECITQLMISLSDKFHTHLYNYAYLCV